MTIELSLKQERMLYAAMQRHHFRSVDEALDEALRAIASPADEPSRVHADPSQAAFRIRELRKGNTLPEGVNIRLLLDEGRA